MANLQVPLNGMCIDTITPEAANGSQQTPGSLAISIDDYTDAYVAKYPGAGTNGFILVQKNPSQVGTKTATVTAHGTDINGVAVPLATKQYDLVGAPPPPPVTQFVFGAGQVGSFPGLPPDPGSNTVTLV